MVLNYGLLLASLILTGYLTRQAKRPSFRHEPVCEKGIAEMNCPGGRIINVDSVTYSPESRKYCQNNASASNLCVASKTDENHLKCGLRKICGGRKRCIFLMAHGAYNEIKLPCRDHGISVRMDILYDCRHADAKDSVINVVCDTGLIARTSSVTNTLTASTQRSSSISTINNTGRTGRTWRWKRPTACNTTPGTRFYLVADSKASCICGSVLIQVSLILVYHMFFKIL
ncbi:uncharacterized protein [Acropora muricata]|uniref:uncharacterized protein n=1 Tax=Acropora muricata TaxID=159855 RepID=UPI0034E43DE7